MDAILTGIVGLLGVFVGALLAAHLGRRNWQRQEAMRTYAQLFTCADQALRVCNDLGSALENLDSAIGDSFVGELSETDPRKQRFREIEEANTSFHKSEDFDFRKLLSQVWLLERSVHIRKRIDKTEEDYLSTKVRLLTQFGKLRDRRKDVCDQMIQKHPLPDAVWKDLDALRRAVARTYFHDDADEETEETKS